MIETIAAVRFDKVASRGSTEPAFVTCENMAGEPAEVLVKLSASCHRKEISLAMELLSACLAEDLGLPAPKPCLVRLDRDWIRTVPDRAWADAARASSPLAFGSARVPAGFNTWIVGTTLSAGMMQTAAAVLLFDAVAGNAFRNQRNPNCLQRGSELRIIDHELCFDLHAGRTPAPSWPHWTSLALQDPAAHIFSAALRGRAVDWAPIRQSWRSLSDSKFGHYRGTLPVEWASALPAVEIAIERIRCARDEIDRYAADLQHVLTC